MPENAILLVEDWMERAYSMDRFFQKCDLNNALHVVSDADEAMDYLAGKGAYGDRSNFPFPNIVLVDLKLPLSSGFDLIRWMRGNSEAGIKELPVVSLSHGMDQEKIALARRIGATAHLDKSSDVTESLRNIAKLNTLLESMDQFHARIEVKPSEQEPSGLKAFLHQFAWTQDVSFMLASVAGAL